MSDDRQVGDTLGIPFSGQICAPQFVSPSPPRPPSTTGRDQPPDLKNERRRRRGRSQATPV